LIDSVGAAVFLLPWGRYYEDIKMMKNSATFSLWLALSE
jgi:hypothetical protein